jgi:hypothetical protein
MREHPNARTAASRFRLKRGGAHENSAQTDAVKRTEKSAPMPKMTLRYRTGRPKPKVAPQDSDLPREFEPENLSQKTNLRFERVNEVTFKLTDGEATNVPASHGQWGGYRTAKAVAWVINIAPGQWLARCRKEASGPSSFVEAKANALAMARGICGDYLIENPIDHLNGLQARSENHQNNEPPAAGAANGSKTGRNRFSKRQN